MIDIKRCL